MSLVLVVAGAGVAWSVVGRDTGPSHPDAWDPIVLPYVEFVESERGLSFQHPVHVDLLADADFRARVTADEGEVTEEDRELIDGYAGLFRALGLVEGELDLLAAGNELAGAGILGFYSFDDQRITMRGTELTVGREATLVHELTHALQDQHFDLGARFIELEEQEEEVPSATSTVLHALIEGDAMRVENAWIAELDEDQLERLEEEELQVMEEYEDETAEVPPVLETLMSAPYLLGEALVAVAHVRGGNAAVDRLMSDPPGSEERLFDPWLFPDDLEEVDVEVPDLADGEEHLDSGVFGVTSWMLVLAERIDLLDALDAADGWGGDAYVAFRREGTTCVRTEWVGDSPADVDEFASALERWAAAGPQGGATVTRDQTSVHFESCEPETGGEGVGRSASEDALQLVLTRTYLMYGMREAGLDDRRTARCLSDALVRRHSAEELNDPEFGGTPEQQETIEHIHGVCG